MMNSSVDSIGIPETEKLFDFSLSPVLPPPVEIPVKKSKKIHFDEEPTREPPRVINCADGKEMLLKFKNDQPTKSMAYQTKRERRQDSRRDFKNGLVRTMFKIKVVTNDDVKIQYKSEEKPNENSSWSTCVDDQDTVVESEEEDNDDINLATALLDLARYSPSRIRSKPTAKSLSTSKSDRSCRRCDIKHGSAEDKKINSVWVGCDGIEDNRPCDYWVHAGGLGFVGARESDFDDRDWFCDKHNSTRQFAKGVKNQKELVKKRRKRKL